jgi:leucyl-tRNA synthetase
VSNCMVLLLAPFAPHLAEELWSRLGGQYSVHQQPWPTYDRDALVAERVTVAIQIDGKTRDRMDVPAGTDRERVLAQALMREGTRRHLGQQEPSEVIFVQDRLINLVTQGRRVGTDTR